MRRLQRRISSEKKCAEQLQGKKIQSNIKGHGNIAQYFLKIKDLMIRAIPLIKRAAFLKINLPIRTRGLGVSP